MAAEHRRVVAETAAHAAALADNLARQGFVVESQTAHEWLLRKPRRRGDITVTVAIGVPVPSPGTPPPPPRPPAGGPAWGPPAGPPA